MALQRLTSSHSLRQLYSLTSFSRVLEYLYTLLTEHLLLGDKKIYGKHGK